MVTNHYTVDVPQLEPAIHGVALSLDAFFINGLQYGVLQQDTFPGFLQKTADNLMRDLSNLEDLASQMEAADRGFIQGTLTLLRDRIQQLVESALHLMRFRALTLDEVRSTVSRILFFREECVNLVKDMEVQLQTEKPFYTVRKNASVLDYLADYERLITEAWTAAR